MTLAMKRTALPRIINALRLFWGL